MRVLLTTLMLYLSSPVLAQGSERYENARYGYTFDIPADFIGQGESDNGDGQAYVVDGRPIELLVWGGTLLGGFEREVTQRLEMNTDDGWIITEQVSTPRWASFAAMRNGQMLNERMIVLCDGASYGAVSVHYPIADMAWMSQIVETLATALRSSAC